LLLMARRRFVIEERREELRSIVLELLAEYAARKHSDFRPSDSSGGRLEEESALDV
jgi:hypothetical protein